MTKKKSTKPRVNRVKTEEIDFFTNSALIEIGKANPSAAQIQSLISKVKKEPEPEVSTELL